MTKQKLKSHWNVLEYLIKLNTLFFKARQRVPSIKVKWTAQKVDTGYRDKYFKSKICFIGKTSQEKEWKILHMALCKMRLVKSNQSWLSAALTR